MPPELRDALRSKKFWAMVGGIILALANDPEPGLALAQSTVNAIVALVGVYIGAQGVADHGKERVKAESKVRK